MTWDWRDTVLAFVAGCTFGALFGDTLPVGVVFIGAALIGVTVGILRPFGSRRRR